MNKNLIKMRQLRSERVELKARLATHELYAAKLRSNITQSWDVPSEDNIVKTNAILLIEARADINACQNRLRNIKREIKQNNRSYEERRAK
jgi:hypothetical protein